MGRLGITHTFSTPLHPQSNGQVERVNKDIINYLTKYFQGSNEWEEQLPLFCWAHNATVTASTGLPPYTVVFGSSPRLPFMPQETKKNYADDYFSLFNQRLTMITDYVKHMQRLATERGEKSFNRHATSDKFDIGSRVYLTSIGGANRPQKLKFKFEGPYIITKDLGNHMYEVKRESDGKISKTHANRVKLVLPAHAMQEIVPPTPEKEQQEGPLPRLQKILKRVTDKPKALLRPRPKPSTRDTDTPTAPEKEHTTQRKSDTQGEPARSPETESGTARDRWNRTKYNLRKGPRFISSCSTLPVFRPPQHIVWNRPRPPWLQEPPWAYHQPYWPWHGPSSTSPAW